MMYSKSFAATLLVLAPLALAQSSMSSKPTASATASGAQVITMMWDNQATAAAGSGTSMSMGEVMTMSNGEVMTMSSGEMMTMSNGEVMSGMKSTSGKTSTRMTTSTSRAMAGMNMTGSAGRTEIIPGAMGAGWLVLSFGAGIGFLAGML